jgi:hypothetical protein
MLSEHDLELLTAFVDGELTRRQRKAVLRLLHRSSEARSVLQDFQENAHRLRELPHVRLGDHFAGQVIEAIAKRGLRPLPEPVAAPRYRWRRWAVYATAASVLLVVGVSVYLATRQTPVPMAQDKSKAGSAPAIALGKLPFSFKELTEKRSQELLAKRLKKEPSVHLDVMVRDGVKAMEHLQTAFKRQDIQLIMDPKIQANLKKTGGKVQYLIYVENVKTEELESILHQLAALAGGQTALANNFQSVVVSSFSQDDHRKITDMLGLKDLNGSKGADDSNLFDNKIMPKENAEPAHPPLRHSSRYAVLLAVDAGNLSATSQEVKTFLESRQRQRPGTLQVVLVIHTA